MELELLKEIWKETEKTHAVFTPAEVAMINSTKSSAQQKIISTLKRNLFVEVLIVLVCTSAIAVFYFAAFNGNFSEVSWVYIALSIIFLTYYYRKNKLLKAMESTPLTVKENLNLRLTALEKYIRFYLISGTTLVPVLLAFFFLLVVYKHIPIFPALQMEVGVKNFILLYIIFSVFLTIALYYLYRRYIYSLYGRHITRLKALLNEMGDEHIKSAL